MFNFITVVIIYNIAPGTKCNCRTLMVIGLGRMEYKNITKAVTADFNVEKPY